MNPSYEGSALFGFPCANRLQNGCLTDEQHVRLHSCEHGTGCTVFDRDDVVYITPIISRSSAGEVVPELGAGGGAKDFIQDHELEIDSLQELRALKKVCSENIDDEDLRMKTLEFISDHLSSGRKSMLLDNLPLNAWANSMSLAEFVQLFARLVGDGVSKPPPVVPQGSSGHGKLNLNGKDLPRRIVSTWGSQNVH